MTYLYQCPYCKNELRIEKPMALSDRVEYCEICEGELKRVFEAPTIVTADGMKK